jgi:hypothetical protein
MASAENVIRTIKIGGQAQGFDAVMGRHEERLPSQLALAGPFCFPALICLKSEHAVSFNSR